MKTATKPRARKNGKFAKETVADILVPTSVVAAPIPSANGHAPKLRDRINTWVEVLTWLTVSAAALTLIAMFITGTLSLMGFGIAIIGYTVSCGLAFNFAKKFYNSSLRSKALIPALVSLSVTSVLMLTQGIVWHFAIGGVVSLLFALWALGPQGEAAVHKMGQYS